MDVPPKALVSKMTRAVSTKFTHSVHEKWEEEKFKKKLIEYEAGQLDPSAEMSGSIGQRIIREYTTPKSRKGLVDEVKTKSLDLELKSVPVSVDMPLNAIHFTNDEDKLVTFKVYYCKTKQHYNRLVKLSTIVNDSITKKPDTIWEKPTVFPCYTAVITDSTTVHQYDCLSCGLGDCGSSMEEIEKYLKFVTLTFLFRYRGKDVVSAESIYRISNLSLLKTSKMYLKKFLEMNPL